MNKAQGLARTRRLADSLLLIMALLFLLSLLLPPLWYWQLVKATSEAALVGALADWFAVSALFRRIPIPIIGRHTAIIANNKLRIAANLSSFMQEKFFNAPALEQLIIQYDPATHLAGWLQNRYNARRLTQMLRQLSANIFSQQQQDKIGRWLAVMMRRILNKLDLGQAAVLLLQSLTRANRHQALLDSLIRQLLSLLKVPSTRQFIARQINQWFKENYPILRKLVSSAWLGDKSAGKLTSIIDNLLLQVAEDQNHQLRTSFNRAVRYFIHRLQHDQQMSQHLSQFKNWIIRDQQVSEYVSQLWNDLRLWVSKDLHRPDSLISAQLSTLICHAGDRLGSDPALSSNFNQHVKQALFQLAPEVTQFLSSHIQQTINNWDDRRLSQQIELNIGKDLQFIRINGCVVGGIIGMLLFMISQLITEWLPAICLLKSH